MAAHEFPLADKHAEHVDSPTTTACTDDTSASHSPSNEERQHSRELHGRGIATESLLSSTPPSNSHDPSIIPSLDRTSSLLQLPPLSLPSTTLDAIAVTREAIDRANAEPEVDSGKGDRASIEPLASEEGHLQAGSLINTVVNQAVDAKTADHTAMDSAQTHTSTTDPSTTASHAQSRDADESMPSLIPSASHADTEHRPLLRSKSTAYEVAPALMDDAAIAQRFLELGPPSVPARQDERMDDFPQPDVAKQTLEAANQQSHTGTENTGAQLIGSSPTWHDSPHQDTHMQEISQAVGSPFSPPSDSHFDVSEAALAQSTIADSATSSSGKAFTFSNSSDIKVPKFDRELNSPAAPTEAEILSEVPSAREPVSTSAGLEEQTPTPILTPYHAFNDNLNLPELDVDSNETDSALGDMGVHSSTASVRSSLYEYVEEHGRTYHRYKAGSYFLPNDEEEQNRLDMQHHLWTMTLHGELNLAPLGDDVMDVLDIATGTGIWAIDFATKHPSATVVGTDLSPIQPPYVPPNCKFEVDDAEDEWMYNHNFDYIHGRLLLTCFKDFKSFMRKCYDNLTPGGWLELADYLPITCHDNSWEGTEIQRWVHTIIKAAQNLGSDWEKAAKYARWAEEIGFVNVNEVQLAHPTNTWPRTKHHKQLGIWMNQNMSDGAHGISAALLTRGLGMTMPEIEVLCVGFRKDLSDKNIHCYAPVRIMYCQKPMQ